MQKKVALMTWYKYYNYGTVLQATAMCKVIKSLGHDVNLINYEPKTISYYTCNKVNRTIFKVAFKKVKELLNPQKISQDRKGIFADFLAKNIIETQPCRSLPELSDLNAYYDAFVCGSDQIWSPLCFDEKYFLSFVDNTDKMIAYAPSMGNNKISDDKIKFEIIKNLKRFKNLSVREEDGKRFINNLIGENAKVVLDPTLLLSSNEWDKIIKPNPSKQIKDKKYIICYFLGEPKRYVKYVERLSKKYNIPYYLIPVKKSQYKSVNNLPFEVGPEEFVSLIKNASYVCTDSFHGMAFSIVYNVPFTAFKRFKDNAVENQNSRLLNLLDKLQLQDRLVDLNKKYDFNEFNHCDYTKANKILGELRDSSKEYLINALNGAFESNVDKSKGNYQITNNCCGCGACYSVCSKNAITIKKDEEGFYHYFIDEGLCVKCGKCKSVCPMTNIVAEDIKNSNALYSIKNKNKQALNRSSSAGVGYALSRYGIKNGYLISGCVYDNETRSARHILINNNEFEKLTMIQGSKYIQSRTSDVFKEIYDLPRDSKLIFFGTPCQVAGMRKLLDAKKISDVVLVDLICHGVPSYCLWEKYLSDINDNVSTSLTPNVVFRDSTSNWHKRRIKIQGNGKTYIKSERKDDFYAFFRRGLCDMNSCSECPYREKSSADIRIGDFWGKRFNNSKYPVSMVIANTQLGVDVLSKLEQEGCVIEKQDLQDYWKVQAPYNLRQSLYRKEIIGSLKSGRTSLHKLRKKYCKYYDVYEVLERAKAKLDWLKK